MAVAALGASLFLGFGAFSAAVVAGAIVAVDVVLVRFGRRRRRADWTR